MTQYIIFTVIITIACILVYRQGYINGEIDGRLFEKYRKINK